MSAFTAITPAKHYRFTLNLRSAEGLRRAPPRIAIAMAAVLSCAASIGETTAKEVELSDALQLGELEVYAPTANEGIQFDPTRPHSQLTLEEIERQQPTTVFDLLQSIPGVALNGGPLANGRSISIRGFQDTEDVLIKVDGAIKDFEKYRFGGGPFVDPDLLKQVEVHRGSGSLLEGAGALGGVVAMDTKDARDFLMPDASIGAHIKYGHNFNNDADTTGLTAYAAPTDTTDILVHWTRQRSNDLRMPDGERLPESTSPRDASLAKAEWYVSNALTLSIGHTEYQAESLEPPDAIAGPESANTFLRRLVTDRTTTAKLSIDMPSPWLQLALSANDVDTRVDDVGTDPAGLPRRGTTHRFDYDLQTLDLSNISRFSWGAIDHRLTAGLQWHRNERRVTEITGHAVNERFAQPPGTKAFSAWTVEDEARWNNFALVAAVRQDHYRVRPSGFAEQRLLAEQRATEIERRVTSHSIRLSYQPFSGPATLTYSRGKGFRPPLIDEYFGILSATCSPAVLIEDTPWQPTGVFDPIPSGTPGYPSGLCADLYEPERATTTEYSLAAEWFGILSPSDRLNTKVTAYEVRVDNLIESMTLVAPTELDQPGIEHRKGWEFELSYSAAYIFGRVGYSHTSGELQCPSWAPVNQQPMVLPADVLQVTLGLLHFGGALEYGYRGRKVYSKETVPEGFIPAGFNPCKAPYPTEREPGYKTHGLFVAWEATDHLSLRGVVDNLTNAKYNFESGASSGSPAPGRSIRLSSTLQF